MVMPLKGGEGSIYQEDDGFILDLLFEVTVEHQDDDTWKEASKEGLTRRNKSGLEILIWELVVLCNSEAKGMVHSRSVHSRNVHSRRRGYKGTWTK